MTAPPDITVTLRCNNDCVFCPRHTLRHVRISGDPGPRLEALRAVSDRVVLTGGEVTVLPEAVELVARCRDLGFAEIGLISNGRALAAPQVARALLDAGLTEVCLTVYDLRPEVHDRLTRTPGSLDQTLRGLDNLLAMARDRVRVNTVLCRDNADRMADLLRTLSGRGVLGFLVADAVLSDAYPEPLPHAAVVDLARATADVPGLVWRGFPLCLLRDLPGIASEAQDIDTAVAGAADLDEYFAEFSGNFAHVPACDRCAEAGRCQGVQRRYLDRLGGDHLEPLTAQPVHPGGAELDGFEPWTDPGRIAVTPTTACQMRCSYCAVDLGRRHAPPEVLDRAVDLLLTSRREQLELQFFGGEPLLRRSEVERTMHRGDERAAAAGKRLRYTITTNGLLLDESLLERLEQHDARVLFSLDGSPASMARWRPPGRREHAEPYAVIERNLQRLVRSGIPYFVNVVVAPEAADELPERLRYLVGLGADTVQVCYAIGPGWAPAARDAFCESLARCAQLIARLASRGRQVRIQNFGSHAEPTVLSNDLLVDVDGTLYGDAALFAEAVLPGLREPYRIGDVFELEGYDGLRRSRRRNLTLLRQTYPEGSAPRQVVEEQLSFGRQVQHTLDRLAPLVERGRRPANATRHRDRNPLLRTVLQQDLPAQVRLMRRLPGVLRLPLLLLHNPCTHDCIFCKAKPLPPTSVEQVGRWLQGNDEAGQIRLGLVGNEPLAHPEIEAIIELARQRGFQRFETLTTGAPVADPAVAEHLVELGVLGYAIPLYARDAATHDAITRCAGSHDQTLRAIEHLGRLGAQVHVHANLLQQNLTAASDLERFVEQDLGLPFCLIPVRPKDARMPYEQLVPSYTAMVETLDVHGLVAFPLCVAGRIQQPALAPAEIIADVLKTYVLDQPFCRPPTCDSCDRHRHCAGTFEAYLRLHGDGELTVRLEPTPRAGSKAGAR